MCGIAAIAGKNLDVRHYATKAMLSALAHRGPDAEGELSLKDVWLGHRRLSIIDVDGGKQPMVDGNLSVTFNGEIYNYKALRTELEKLGHSFTTNSDTEVLLKSYREWGEDSPKHLDGMFAFALWDNTEQSLFLARDRFGKKPLYYAFEKDTILVSSEIKSLLASGVIKGELSRESLDNYLRLMYIPPWKSVYANIHQVPPAHAALFKNGRITTTRYWTLTYKPITISYNEAKDEVRRLLTQAVGKRMLAADVEVGALLSGGVDSTIVSLIAADFLNHPLKTFSLGYGNYINELPYAQQASDKIGSEHYTLQADSNMVHELEKVIAYFDEPHADNSDFPQHLVSKLAASKVKVALSGDGGDELFFGYGWHTRHKNLSYKSHTFEKLFLSAFAGRVRTQRIFSPLERMLLWGSPRPLNNDIFDTGAYESATTPMEKINTFDLTTYLPGQLLTKVDRASMMHGLEIRSPLLDTELAEFVCNLPVEFKAGVYQKHILKDILSERMPESFVHRRKQGFGAPSTKWLQEKHMSAYTREKLGPNAHIRSLLNGRMIDFYLRDFYEKNRTRGGQRLWILLCLEIWLANK